MEFRPRPKQKEVLDYTGGKMGVSAVPGSGKTFTLSALAAKLVTSGLLEDDQEVLVVTLVNSAVDNFRSRVDAFVEAQGLLPGMGYRVRTLHGLAHDIVRERPGLTGLSDDFDIVDERTSEQMLQDASTSWVRAHPDFQEEFLSPTLEAGKREWVSGEHWPRLVSDVARAFIKQAKDLGATPEDVQRRLAQSSHPFPLVEMGVEIYANYQRALRYQGAVDFDDLIRLALDTLRADEELLRRLRHQWPYVLEDEAQDSSRMQELILKLLVGDDGNWVRVGDPNQAIYETFTTADPEFLRDFLDRKDVQARTLPNSGRSTRSIITLANRLIDWVRDEHPVDEVRQALAEPYIEPTPPGDPQPNPTDRPGEVHFFGRKLSPRRELEVIVDSIERWLPEHTDETVAVLVPRNERGFAVVSELKRREIDYVELLRSTRATRETAGALANVIRYLAQPASAKRLSTVYRVWRRDEREDEEANARLQWVSKALGKCRNVEDFLWPRLGRDWLDELELDEAYPEVREQLEAFRTLVRRWQGATVLPIDQLILTLAQDLFEDPADLAVAHKLAGVLHRMSENHPQWRLPELVDELVVVAQNQRRFLGLSDEDRLFDPDEHKGQVVVATVHKAKGLEWDRVYLMAVNDYNFPSALPHDRFISEKWFIRDQLNLQAEALAQLRALVTDEAYEEGQPTAEARVDYAAERLRLLYVGITRARKELIVTWNTGRRSDDPQQPSIPFVALETFWEKSDVAE